LNLEAKAFSEGSIIPPRRRRTKCRVDSYEVEKMTSQCIANNQRPPECPQSLFVFSGFWASIYAFETNLLDVVVGQSSAILELLASEDQSLLIRGNSLLVLNLGLDIVDRVRGLDLESDGLARQGLHETTCFVSTVGRKLKSEIVAAGRIELTSALFKNVSIVLYFQTTVP
jgi:hypothetical protein